MHSVYLHCVLWSGGEVHGQPVALGLDRVPVHRKWYKSLKPIVKNFPKNSMSTSCPELYIRSKFVYDFEGKWAQSTFSGQIRL